MVRGVIAIDADEVAVETYVSIVLSTCYLKISLSLPDLTSTLIAVTILFLFQLHQLRNHAR